LPVEEVQRLCDVHAAVFKGSVEDIHRPQAAADTPGHPAHTLKAENRALEALMEKIRPAIAALKAGDAGAARALAEGLETLREI
ncbi:DUF438 domain-containing protein, partial [Acinetobacter baumannii]|uniref:DUF438 domain-containing protein n=1 Tax=Acinetobacter baumannii TaxID=470 RepID=UPI001158548B